MSPELSPAARAYLTAFADDEHLIGARHTSWIGTAPFLEEDLAFCSIAQDELGHAIALYELVTDDVDRFALLRAPGDYRSCALAEAECADWADALVRHALYDHAESLRWEALAGSTIPGVGDIAARARRDEEFHLAHADALVGRLLAVGGEPAERIAASLAALAPSAVDVWSPPEMEDEAVAQGVVAVPSAVLAERWRADLRTLFGPLPESLSAEPAPDARTHRSAGFAELHAQIRRVIELDPTARW